MMKTKGIRDSLNALLVQTLSDAEWKWLIKRRYVDEVGKGEGTVDELAREIRDLRSAFGRPHDNGEPFIARELNPSPQVPPVDDSRTKGLSRAVAYLAQQEEQDIHLFRNDVLGGRVLRPAEAARWLARESKTSTRGSIRFLGEGTAALNRLERLAQDLATIYAWAEPDAERFILTGKVPRVFPVAVSTASRRIPALSRIVLTLDPMVPPNQVANLYRGLRRIFYPQRTRRISAKHAELAAFVLGRPTGVRWQETMDRWNKARLKRERYEHVSNFVRDSKRALDRLLGVRA